MFMGEGMDPDHCWVTEGKLTVSSVTYGSANETDYAVLWKTFF